MKGRTGLTPGASATREAGGLGGLSVAAARAGFAVAAGAEAGGQALNFFAAAQLAGHAVGLGERHQRLELNSATVAMVFVDWHVCSCQAYYTPWGMRMSQQERRSG
jgi:hypothetical protein